MARVLGFLIRYFDNYYTLHRSDLRAARAAPLDPRLISFALTCETYFGNLLKYVKTSIPVSYTHLTLPTILRV